MSAKAILPLIIVLLIGCQQVAVSQNAVPADQQQAAEPEPGRQLKIYKNTLLAGTSEDIRIDAATELIFSEEPSARAILIEVLGQPENPSARAIICKALSRTRTLREPLRDKDDFIEPLFNILIDKDTGNARLAAEAIMIFEYRKISRQLEKIASDPAESIQARLNAVYALKLQPDMKAVFKLINLLDDPDSKVASASENALRYLAVPVGENAKERKQIINELRRKGENVFFRDLRIRRQSQMRQMETELNLWQGRYLTALDTIYQLLADDQQRGQFLTEQLNGPDAVIRLWAVKKLSQWRIGTRSNLPENINPILINLISDSDANVRLNTAKLLALMVEINSAEKLLQQLELERDDAVATELFVALGGACHYAFLPNAKIKVPADVKKQALDWAVKFLRQQDSRKAQKGADVIRKLLERNGLTSGEANGYLALISERSKQLQAGDSQLRSELFDAMAGLCAQSVYKNEAAKLYKPLFEGAIKNESAMVRESSVKGLICMDKAKALDIFRQNLLEDDSRIIQNKLIELAGEVGGRQDLVWLAEKLPVTDYSQGAWAAMLQIFKQPEIEISTLGRWMDKFEDPNAVVKLSDERRVSFLEVVRRRAEAAQDNQLLRKTLGRLADIYTQAGEFEQAAESLGLLREITESPRQKQDFLIRLLDVYLRWPNAEKVRDLVHNRLLEGDMYPNDIIAGSIERHFSAGTDANSVLAQLRTIAIEGRPVWQKQMDNWTERFSRPQKAEPNEPNRPAEDRDGKAQPIENKQ